MYSPVLVAAPATNPVTITEAKATLDVPYTEKDTLITDLISAATNHLERLLDRRFITQTWRQDFDGFERCLRLPLVPVASIASVKYDDADSVEQTVNSANYALLADESGAYVRFADGYSFPTTDGIDPTVRVAYVVGEAAAEAAIKRAILMLVRHWFDNPSAVQVGQPAQAMPMAVEALIGPYRRMQV
jgi:uncharacterized phiE125 gp8 family phage protein